MAVHSDGLGGGWLEDLDADQPHGLDYREFNDLRIGIDTRMSKEHESFGDTTAGGEHLPGKCGVLLVCDDTADFTAYVDATTAPLGSMAYCITHANLWCITATASGGAPDFTVVKLGPLSFCLGADYTWTGAQEFDGTACFDGEVEFGAAVDFSADATVTIGGDLTVGGTAHFDGTVNFNSPVEFSSDVTVVFGGAVNFDGTVDFNTGPVDFSSDVTVTVSGDLKGGCKSEGSTVFDDSMTAANTFQDLDLSGYIGSNIGLAFLEIKAKAGASGTIFTAKPKGYGGTGTAHLTDYSSGGTCVALDANEYTYFAVATDTNGFIQIASDSNTIEFTIKLVGYVT